MSLCPKCVIGGIVQGGGMLSFDESADLAGFHLEFDFELRTDDEQSQGSRHVTFDGTLAEGTLVDGVIRGRLEGHFDVETARKPIAEATVETFSSRGLLTFINITVPGPFGPPSFSANLRPAIRSVELSRALQEVSGTVFLGWDDPARAEGNSN